MKAFKKTSLLMLCCVTVVLFAGCTIGAGPNRQDLSSMIRDAYPKVVSIETSGGTAGSGVIIYTGSDGDGSFSLVATNAHVITDRSGDIYPRIDIINWSTGLLQGEYNTAPFSPWRSDALKNYTKPVNLREGGLKTGAVDTKVVYHYMEAADLAIIRYTPPAGLGNRLATLRTTTPRVGEPIAALGYSLASFHRTSIGVVSQVFPKLEFYDDSNIKIRDFEHGFMHDATALPGNSGGPVFDARGEVIGLSTMVVMMCCSECERVLGPGGWSTIHHCDLPALGFSVAISAKHIAKVLDGLVEFHGWGD